MILKNNSFLQSGKYRIERVLGQGGFGITYLATQVGLNRKVAIKEFFMKEYCERDSDTSQVSMGSSGSKELVSKFKSKFIKEAQTIADLDNHHIIRIYDVFEENGTAYYVMEYLSNGDLRGRIPSNGMPELEAVGYIKQLCSALSYIHSKNILHLDIKPGNVLFRQSGEAVLIDFGVSKHYEEDGGAQTTSTPVGISHGYAPTEQYEIDGVSSFSVATDIYALGATLYCLIVGERPPKASVVLNDGLPSKPSGVSSDVWQAIECAMQPSKKKRPQSISEFLQLLDGVASDSEETELTDLGGYNSHDSNGEKGSSTPLNSTSSGSKSSSSKSHDVGQSSFGSNVSGSSHQNNSSSKSSVSNGKKKKGMFYGIIGCILAAIVSIIAINLIQQSNANKLVIESASSAYLSLIHAADSLSTNPSTLHASKEKYLQASRYEEEYGSSRYSYLFSKNASVSALLIQSRIDSLAAAEQAAKEQAEQARLAQQRAEAERKAREAAQRPTSGTLNGHEWVDLGLSVKWATCNVGAGSPEGYGSYFAWGETSSKSDYDWDTYKYCRGSSKTLTKYCNDSDYGYNGYTDNKTTLDLIDDAARVNWGGSWRMPTRAEQEELIEKCTWTWTTLNGVKGRKVTGPNGNSIFLPVAGYRSGTDVSRVGTVGCFWSSSLGSVYTNNASHLYFASDDILLLCSNSSRYDGYSVRAVCP